MNRISISEVLCGLLAGASLSCTHAEMKHVEAVDLLPELAAKNGYFVSGDEASDRGGIGNYVPIPHGAERERQDRLRQMASFADFERQSADTLAVRLKREFLFDVGSSEIKTSAHHDLGVLVDYLKAEKFTFAQVEGFADSTGTASSNQELSHRRAEAIQTAMLQQGMDRDRIGTTAYGERFPVRSNTTAQGRAQNRRVELVLIHQSIARENRPKRSG